MKSFFNVVLFKVWLPGLVVFSQAAFALDFQGKIGGEALLFFQEPKYAEQKDQYLSVFIEPEIYQAVGDNQELVGKLFYRYDAQSASRTHVDIRELMFNTFADEWELNVGVGKVFWGTTESRHLVDVVNQVDWIESLDDEARLGQPMLQGKFIKDWGTLDLFFLPTFREVQFLGAEARPRIDPVVDTKQVIYQAKSKSHHVDLAGRWSRTFDDLDIGLSLFNGTQRMPILTPQLDNQGQVSLIPVYVQTTQFGLDGQYIYQDWLLKVEALGRESHHADFSKHQSFAGIAGFEYTLVGVFDTIYDVGLIGEYMYDDWQALTPFQKDWMSGIRLVMNDTQSTEILFGNIYDLDDDSQLWRLEASRRVGRNWTIEVLGRWLTNVGDQNPWYQVYKQDDLISIKANYYF